MATFFKLQIGFQNPITIRSIHDDIPCVLNADILVVSTSCSLLHTAKLVDKEIKSWPAFSCPARKVVEVNALGKALAGQKG